MSTHNRSTNQSAEDEEYGSDEEDLARSWQSVALGFYGSILEPNSPLLLEVPEDRVLKLNSFCLDNSQNTNKAVSVQVRLNGGGEANEELIVAVVDQHQQMARTDLYFLPGDQIQLSIATFPANANVKVHVSGFLSFFSSSDL